MKRFEQSRGLDTTLPKFTVTTNFLRAYLTSQSISRALTHATATNRHIASNKTNNYVTFHVIRGLTKIQIHHCLKIESSVVYPTDEQNIVQTSLNAYVV